MDRAAWTSDASTRTDEGDDGTTTRRRTTTRASTCATYIDVGRDALLAHRTQIPPDSFFFRVPLEVQQERHPWEEYVLARSLVDPGTVEGEYETDLFAGLRVAASS